MGTVVGPDVRRDAASADRDADRAFLRRRAIVWFAVTVFLVHAANYLYFFVDDEAIPFVYAQNVLEGRGLVYDPADGPVEGYSDFLHVWVSTAVLAGTRAAGAPKISVFFVGKVLSLICGAAILWATARILSAAGGISATGLAAGVGALALAGPLALWSCSSLETTAFALLFVLFVGGVIRCGESARADILTAVAAVAMILERIDGFVYVGAVIVAFGAIGPPGARRLLLRRIAVPAAAGFVVYHAWRIAWFGSALPLPLEAKVWFKLAGNRPILRKLPEHGYVARFLAMYGFVPVLIVAAAAYVGRGRRWIQGVVVSMLCLVAYLWIVSDWMFGFRFFVAVLPLLALLLATVVSWVESRRPAAGVLLACLAIAGAAAAAHRFEAAYEAQERRPSWIRHPREGLRRYFTPYYETVEKLAARIRPGETMAFNQAGFLPFLLDVPNIDNLGICTPFFARIPTPDTYFTEVGRYSPLTNRRVLRAADAYLLYRRPTYIVETRGLIRSANGGLPPAFLLGDRYRLLSEDTNVVYRAEPGRMFEEFRRDPNLFRENLAHTATVLRVRVNGEVVPAARTPESVRFLDGDPMWVSFNGAYALEVDLARHEVTVDELFVHDVRAHERVSLTVALLAAAGEVRLLRVLDIGPGGRHSLHVPFDPPVGVHRLRIVATSPGPGPAAVRLQDVRLQGQSPQLGAFIRTTLAFTP